MPDSLSIPKLLRQYFPQLAEKQLQEDIASFGQLYHFSADQIIMDFGEYVRMVPLVIEGSIKVLRENEEGREILLYYLQPGQTCSMSFTCCMTHKKSMIRTIAEEKTTVIGIPIQYMDDWMTVYKSWKNFVMTAYDFRMIELIKVVDSIAFKQMDTRLLEYLQTKAAATQSSVIYSTHQDIAKDLNASREAVSRLLKQLERMGKVRLGRNQVELIV